MASLAAPSSGHPPVLRSINNTIMAACSTSGRGPGYMLWPKPARRRARAHSFMSSRLLAAAEAGIPQHISHRNCARKEGVAPANTRAVACMASSRAASIPSPERGSRDGEDGVGSNGNSSSSAESPSGPVAPYNNGGGSVPNSCGAGGFPTTVTQATASETHALFADLEDAVPYSNGTANGGKHAAGAKGPAKRRGSSAGAGATSKSDNVGSDSSSGQKRGNNNKAAKPGHPMPTVASIMHPNTDPASVAAAVNGGDGPVSVVDAAIAASVVRQVLPYDAAGNPSSGVGSSGATIHADGMAACSDLTSDVSASTSSMDGSTSSSTARALANALSSSTPPSPLSSPSASSSAASSASALGPQGSSGSVDLADTPEGLTDVEVISVAPVADWLRDRDDIYTLYYAVLTGGLVATAVFLFDVSIQTIHDLPDIFSTGLGIGGGRKTGLEVFGTAVPFRCVMPVAAGLAVAWLQRLGFSPPLKVLTRAMEGVADDAAKAALPKSYWQVARKAIASAVTLGSGASLGPEAPSVELGANTAAVIVPKTLSKRRQRMLVAAGAAAGVSAAFDAPVSGALFAVEFVLKSSRLGLDRLSTSTVFVSTSVAAGVIGFLRTQGQALGIAGAGTHLVGRIPYFSIQPNLLVDVLQFSALGSCCAVAAVALYEGVRVCEIALRPLPRWLSAPTAGALCGIIAYRFPQVQYGYVNLEEIFRDSTRMSAGDLAALLTAKIAATAVCVGGGLVGGLFAPSLFLGALVGDVMGHFVAVPWGLPDPTSLVVVGAAAVLGASCRAPLTAVALMVEITRDTGLLVPLLAAIGAACLLTDYMEGVFSKRLEQALVQLYLREKAFFWAASLVEATERQQDAGAPKTVESVLGTRASLYVRHTLPLAQAKSAMLSRGSQAAVVVDDNLSPLGVVYLEDVEAELLRQRLMNEPDANFNRE
ncbi:hypothetical protein Agub_g10016 [Astrephomene gubernaculifera]|uniref:Chloride channel protein n=1 Tax=Astrephomene gubernaculifera TaxID=47775 RepID=A0AAD3HNR5_9CHLO|nr:hypothetical protein Agub_g10016 [Astrephomene gubernaculifera]